MTTFDLDVSINVFHSSMSWMWVTGILTCCLYVFVWSARIICVSSFDVREEWKMHIDEKQSPPNSHRPRHVVWARGIYASCSPGPDLAYFVYYISPNLVSEPCRLAWQRTFRDYRYPLSTLMLRTTGRSNERWGKVHSSLARWMSKQLGMTF